MDFLQYLCSNDVDVPIGENLIDYLLLLMLSFTKTLGHATATGMHNEQGGYENDGMLIREQSNRYII